MQFDLGLTGFALAVVISLIFGLIAQFIGGRRAGTPWLWLIGAAGWLVGGLFASEVLWGTMTVEEIQPIIDGLAFDEFLLGGLVTGIAVVVITLLVTRGNSSNRPMSV